MSRMRRNPPGGHIYHVLNRSNRRSTLFETAGDYLAFLKVVQESLLLNPMRIIDFNVMPNHWHFVLWPFLDGELAAFMHHLTTTHAARWNGYRGLTGTGHVYQGPYKFFPVESDEHHYLRLCRYVVRNALRAQLVERAEDWPWCSLHARCNNTEFASLLSEGPIPYPTNWLDCVNEPQTESELDSIRSCIQYDYPYGTSDWSTRVARKFGFTNRPGKRGRPGK